MERNKVNAFLETGTLRNEAFTAKLVPNEIQDSLRKASRNLDLVKVGLPKISIDSSYVDFYEPFDTKKNTQWEDSNSITKNSNEC